MTEEYKEVIDYKKIGLIGLVIGVAILLIMLFIMPIFTQNIAPKEIEKIVEQPEQNQIRPEIKPQYQKFIDLGITEDDVVDFQEMPCEIFDTPEKISPDPKYTAIIEQRKSECT